MKLEDFVHENGTVNAVAGGEDIGYFLDAPLPKNLHVIGTCGECEHYLKEDTSPYGYCDIQENPQNRIVIKPDFGCIHFEPKQKEKQ